MPPAPFAVLRNGEPIELSPLRRTVKTGIAYGDPRIDIGLVAEYEEREAAAHAAIPWMAWLAAPLQERAAGIAHYRLQYLIQMHGQDALQSDSELRQAASRRQTSRSA